MTLSVIISTKNSESIIERALKSVSFADEIVVVDMHSQDKTLDIVKKYTDKFFLHQDYGYIEPVRNFSISKTSGDWILIIDADEEVTPGLKKTISSIVKAKDQADLPDCFYLPRKNIIFDKWIQKTGWWPDYQLRFFRKDHIEWSDQIHSVPITKGEVKEFPAKEKFALLHHNYQSVSQFIDRLNRYSSIQSQEKSTDAALTSSEIIEEFTSSFLRRLFSQEGIEDGVHGASLSILQSTADAVMKMKIWEKQGFPQKKQSLEQTFGSLAKFKRELSYWMADTQIKHTSGVKKLVWRLRRKLMV
jgi:glycosyltransferase involved in cell wall biosynthesis